MFDRIIVSTDENPMFIQFLPIVSKAWKKYFPDKKLSVAFITNRIYEDPLVKKMQQYADIRIFHLAFGIPPANQAKMSRFILASEYEDEVCMLDDMDTIPLQKDFFIDRTSKRKPNTVLQVGAEVLAGGICADKAPISTITAEGRIFKEFINPENLHYIALLNSWRNMKIKSLDNQQDINNEPYRFSDESLISVLLRMWDGFPSRITNVERAVDIHQDWIDRSWWGIDEEKMKAGKYICCNFLRPFSQHYNQILPIVKHIYGEDFGKEEMILMN